MGQAQRLDPVVDLSLTSAGQILSRNDPGAPRTMNLIKRIIVAGPILPGAQSPSSIRKVSDLNPTLEKIVFARENPLVIGAGILGILGLTFALGRMTARKG